MRNETITGHRSEEPRLERIILYVNHTEQSGQAEKFLAELIAKEGLPLILVRLDLTRVASYDKELEPPAVLMAGYGIYRGIEDIKEVITYYKHWKGLNREQPTGHHSGSA